MGGVFAEPSNRSLPLASTLLDPMKLLDDNRFLAAIHSY